MRVSRAHYRLLWAALSFMDQVPVKNGRRCVFRVVKVSGTIRRVEEEAIRRAKQLMFAAQEQAAGRSSDALASLFGGPSGGGVEDFSMVDAEGDNDGPEGEVLESGGDG